MSCEPIAASKKLAARSLLIGQLKIKTGAFVGLRFRRYPAAVFGNNSSCGGQSYARSVKFAAGMQPLKRSKKFIVVIHIKAGSVVFYIINDGAGFFLRTDFNLRFFFPGG